MSILRTFSSVALALFATTSFANSTFLSPDEAFKFQATSISEQKAELKWNIEPNYYLYHDQFKVTLNQKDIPLSLPKGQEKNDPTFGQTNVHYNSVATYLNVKPNTTYTISWQGCSEDGLCYPVKRTTIQTDAEGLLPQQKLAESNSKLALSTNEAKSTDTISNEPKEKLTTVEDIEAPAKESVTSKELEPSLDNTVPVEQSNDSTAKSSNAAESVEQASSMSSNWNNDQFFLNLLTSQNFFVNIIIFLGFGILLAFLPCSLPLIPILSSILIQRNKGYKAVVIALTFVVSMALVYGLMGLIVSQIGYNVQRWFQSPIFISIFAILFIVFALNLFGLYQLSMPQALMQRLDAIQQRQKGGTLLGASVMGAVSALIVGPCMSAPLAGALLYVSYLEQSLLAGFYLFLLGLGMGIPLFIASVFGAKYLPKPGLWMDRLKFSFGFVMLIMAVYFARPLLPVIVYYVAFALILVAMSIYLFGILRHIVRLPYKLLIIILASVLASSGIWHASQALASVKQEDTASLQQWIIVKNKTELDTALNMHASDFVVIDVYADWCVACQPIKRDVFPRADVQDSLKNVIRIKLDLSNYEASQDLVLKEWQVLGPPTILFLEPNKNERRDLRITGTFTAPQLIENIKRLRAEEK